MSSKAKEPVSEAYVARLQQALADADAAGNYADAYDLADALREALSNTRKEILKQRLPSEYNPEFPGFIRKYGATSAMTAPQRAAAGAGKFLADTGRGVKQLTGNMTRDEVDAANAQDAELMATTAGMVGNIGGGVAFTAPAMFIPGANTYAGAALIGGGMGAVRPVGTNDSRAFNMALGAGGSVLGKAVGDRIAAWASRPRPILQPGSATTSAAGGGQAAGTVNVGPSQAGAQTNVTGSVQMSGSGGGYTFGSVGDDASAGLSAAQREIMERGRDMGMRLTPGQATGSRALQQLEAKLESQPMTSGPFNTIRANNSRVAARAVAASIGESADEVSAPVLNRAAERIGGVFDDAGDDVIRAIDPQRFVQTYSGIQQEVRGLTKGFDSHPLVEDLIGFAHSGNATGRQLQSLTSKLGKAAYKEMSTPMGDRDLGLALYQVKDYVDDLLRQGMSAERAARFDTARTQYRNLLMLTSRVGVVNSSTGQVSGRSLANVLQSKDKAGFMYGRNTSPMYDAARFAQAFAPIVGDSGTATRMPLQGVTDFLTRVPLNIATRAYTSGPAVNMAMRTQAAAQAAGRAVSPVVTPASNFARTSLGTLPYYAPYELPVMGGLLGPYAAAE